ncbi:MAG TPA: SDR family NAD(P)-dependent oxidoreductase [Bryobacteraceae bacterium]|nr:SDR family NAD(P)-dependent oxidoreductase [Bryobacteraceae bacterium]
MAIVITGAAGGLGSAVCRVFTEAGVAIVAVDRQWRESQAYATIAADLTTRAGAEAMIAEAAKIGTVDGLVHLVGGFAGGASIAETDEATWESMMNLNLRVAVNTIQAALEPMLAAKHGRIAAIGSRAAVEASPNYAAYAVSKAAVVALIKTLAAEVRDSNITANVVLPSTIDTAANRKSMPKADFTKWVAPESIARLLLWLTSKAAGDTSGAVIPIYGKA